MTVPRPFHDRCSFESSVVMRRENRTRRHATPRQRSSVTPTDLDIHRERAPLAVLLAHDLLGARALVAAEPLGEQPRTRPLLLRG